MDISEPDGLLPHHCEHCKNIIEIDGNGPYVKQSFEFTLLEVQAHAKEYMLFQ
jgi:hypothetical protein